MKKKLKPEYVEKLSQLGLKWSVHERRYSDDPRDCPTSIRPDNAPSSSANDNIPSTIAVPSRAVEKASVSEAFAAKSKESTSEENAPPNLDSDAKAEAAKPISAKMDPTSSTPVAAEQTPVKNSAVLAVETSKISSTLNSPAVEVPGSIFSCAKASVQTIKPVPGTTQEEIESASKAEGLCAATNVDKPVPCPNFPLKSSESEEKQQPGSVVNGSLATDTATVSEALRAINATLPAYNICESAQKGPSALEIGENDKHDVDGELKVEEQARKTPPISDEPTIGSNPNPTGLQTSSTKEASVLCKDPPPENSPGQADCNETSAAVVKEVQSDPKPDEPRQAESEKLAPGEGNQSIDADDAAPPKDVIKESEEAREGIIPAVETQDISSPPVVASEAHAPGATSGTMTDADTVEENALKTKEVEQEVPPAMQERTDTSESVARSIVMTDDSSGARNEATGERSGTEMEKPVEPSSKSTGESNAEKCTEKYDKVEITKPNAREEDQNANVAETSTPEPSAAVENSNNSSSQVDLPTEKEDLERGHEEASNDTSTDDSDAVDNKSKIDSSVGVGAPEGDEKYSATPQPSNQCSPRATPEKSKSPQQAQPSTESRKRKGSESSGSEKAKGSKLKNSLKNLQIDMKIDQTKARGGRNARPTRSVSKKDCRQQC